MRSFALFRTAGWAGLVVAAAAVSACGMPGDAELAQAPAVASEAPAELLGGPGVIEALIAEAAPVEPEAASPETREPVRRAGWGTMAPIANPLDDPPRFRASVQPMTSDAPAPYRLAGAGAEAAPAAPPVRTRALSAAPTRRAAPARPVRAAVQSGPTGWILVEAEPVGTSRSARARVRHWIMPAAQRR